ncbi:MAG: winged helix-turn-helix domain-containing protein [Coprococcus sp.]
MKRAKGTIREDELVCDAIRMNVLKYRVTVDGKEVDLSPKEFALLRMLLENKGTLLLRERLLIGIWGYDYEGTDRCVDNHVRKLRKHLGNAGRCIKTVVGKGYKIEEALPKKGA